MSNMDIEKESEPTWLRDDKALATDESIDSDHPFFTQSTLSNDVRAKSPLKKWIVLIIAFALIAAAAVVVLWLEIFSKDKSHLAWESNHRESDVSHDNEVKTFVPTISKSIVEIPTLYLVTTDSPSEDRSTLLPTGTNTFTPLPTGTNSSTLLPTETNSSTLLPSDTNNTKSFLPTLSRWSITGEPSMHPSTALPTFLPSTTLATQQPTVPVVGTTTFFVIGDVPYNDQQAVELVLQMDDIPATADFVVHVGDIRTAGDGNERCNNEEYESVAQILQRSAIPVFMLPGDNEWNDCYNTNQAWNFWLDNFQGFEGRYWSNARFGEIVRMPDRPETFSFVHQGTLFIGLNLVGGRVHDAAEWQTRLTEQATWVQELMRLHSKPTVVFGHANPLNNHDDFFIPMRDFVRDEWQNSIPLMHINGDKHTWEFNGTFYDQHNWQRIMVSGGTSDPPLKVQAHSGPSIQHASQAFTYDRQLPSL